MHEALLNADTLILNMKHERNRCDNFVITYEPEKCKIYLLYILLQGKNFLSKFLKGSDFSGVWYMWL